MLPVVTNYVVVSLTYQTIFKQRERNMQTDINLLSLMDFLVQVELEFYFRWQTFSMLRI